MNKNYLTRRDFLKLCGLGLAGLFAPRIELISPESAEFSVRNNLNSIIFNGRTVSLDEAINYNPRLAFHLDGVIQKLDSIETTGVKPENVPGYNGLPFSDRYHLSFSDTTLVVNETEKGGLITQAVISRRDDNGIPEGVFNLGKSLMVAVEGKEHKAAWFDNLVSKDILNLKETKITVDTVKGKVYQIVKDAKNTFSAVINDVKGDFLVKLLDPDAGVLNPVFMPNTAVFLSIFVPLLQPFQEEIKKLNDSERDAFLEEFYQEVLSPNATLQSSIKFFNSLMDRFQVMVHDKEVRQRISENQQKFLEWKDFYYNSEIPLDIKDSLDLMAGFKYFLDNIQDPTRLMEIANIDYLAPNGDAWKVPIAKSLYGNKKEEKTLVNEIADKEIQLPYEIPQLFIVPIIDKFTFKKRFVLVARYSASDSSLLGVGQKDVTPGETIVFISDTKSEDPLDVFGRGFFNNYNKKDLQTKIKYVSSQVLGQTDPVNWFGGNYLNYQVDQGDIIEIKPEEVKMFYDPAGSGNKLFAGLELRYGKDGKKGEIFEIRQSKILTKGKYSIRNEHSNRPNLFFGEFPYGILDVTREFINLRKKGYQSASEFAFLPPPEAASQILGLTGLELDYSSLKDFLGSLRTSLPEFKEKSKYKDKAHSLVITRGENIPCHQYKIEDKGFFSPTTRTRINTSNIVQNNMLLRAYEIVELDGSNQVVIARDSENLYTVPEESMMFVGVESDFILTIQNALVIGALLFGGYKVLNTVPGRAIASFAKTIINSMLH
jgi:hypothetical protein